MTDKNYDDMSDDGIRIIGPDVNCGPKKHFCKGFAARCPFFENSGLCTQGQCIHASPNIPSSDEMLRLQLLQIRRTQLDMARMIRYCGQKLPSYKPKTR